MKSAAHQKAAATKPVHILCSVERLKKMVCAAQGGKPDRLIEGGSVAEWETVGGNEVGQFVNFANLFLYTGNAVIKVVDKEPESRLIVLPK